MSKCLGILGCDAKSTDFYLSLLKEQHVDNQLVSHVFHQVDFAQYNNHLPNNFEVLIPLLLKDIETLLGLGVDQILIPNITLYRTLDRIDVPNEIDVCHPFKLLSSYDRFRYRHVMVLGTRHTMHNVELQQDITDASLGQTLPTLGLTRFVDEMRLKVYQNRATQYDIAGFNQAVKRLSKRLDVVIACTELSQILSRSHASNVVDLALLQVQNIQR